MTAVEFWGVVDEWLRQHSPATRKLLKKPATAAGIAKLEKTIKQVLPDEFKEFLKIHNGSEESAGLLVGLPVMSAAEISHQWREWAEIADDEEMVADLSEEITSHPEGHVKPLYANRGWVPFIGDSQNHIAVDYDPGPKGKIGQIINCGRDDDVRHVIAESFEEFLDFVAYLFRYDFVELNPEHSSDDPPRWLRVKGQSDDLLTGLPELLAKYRAR